MTDRETFFPGDRPTLVYECRRPNIYVFSDPDGIPAQPTDVWIKIFNGTAGTMVEVDGSETIPLGPEGTFLYMSAMNEAEDRGALLYVSLPPEMADVTGNYTLYITTEYEDQTRITHDQRIQISEYR